MERRHIAPRQQSAAPRRPFGSGSWLWRRAAAGVLAATALLLAACSSHGKVTEAAASAPADTLSIVPQPEPSTVRLSTTERQRYNALYLSSVTERLAERYDAAHDLLQRALEINPDAPEALFDMGLIKLSMTSMLDSTAAVAGERMLRKAVRRDPGNEHYNETLSRYLLHKGDVAGATAIYERLAAQHPSQEHLSALVKLYEQAGRYAQAVETLERLERLEGQSEELELEKVSNYLQLGDTVKLYGTLRRLIADNPDDERFRVALGDIYYKTGRKELSLQTYNDVLRRDTANVYALRSLMQYYHAEHNDTLYRATARRLLLNPATDHDLRLQLQRDFLVENATSADTAGILRLLSDILALPDADEATATLNLYYLMAVNAPAAEQERVLRFGLDHKPTLSRFRYSLLQLMVESNADNSRNADIAAFCRESEAVLPADIVFYYYEGVSHYGSDELPQALNAFQRGANVLQADTADADSALASDFYAIYGDVLHEAGRQQAAFRAYDRALLYNPLNLLCLNNYAYFLSLKRSNLHKAEEMSRKTIEAEPTNETYLDTYAWVLYCLGEYEQARVYIDQTLLNAPADATSATLYDHAGDIYLRCGRRTEARRYWQQALRLTDDEALRTALQRKLR